MIVARALLAVPTLLMQFGPARDDPLEVAGVDASAFPTVVVDLVAPVRHSAQRITAAMVEVDGAAVESVTAVDPRDVAVGLVIDDRPEATPALVTKRQGAAVELVRNTGEGIQISLGTPSGLRTALTSDRGANIARIAGITAGAPAVIPMPVVLTETVAELASSPAADRHAVVVLGGAVAATDAQVSALVEALAASGTALHVLVPANVEPGALARIAARSGGSVRRAPEPLASMDRVTATISKRYLVVARVAGGGEHRVRLSVGGERFGAVFQVPAADRPASASASTVAPEQEEPEEPGEPGELGEPEEPEAASGASATTIPPARPGAPPPSTQGGLPIRAIGLGVIALALATLVAAAVVFVVRRFGGGGDDDETVIVKRPSVAPVAAAKAPPVSAKATAASKAPPVSAKATAAAKTTPSPAAARKSASPPPSRTKTPATPRPAKRASVAPPARRPARSRVPPVTTRSPTTQPDQDTVAPPADSAGEAPEWIIAGDLRVSRSDGEVWCGKRRVELNASELGVLELLMTSGGRGVTRDEIIEAGQLDELDGPDAVDAIVTQVRRKTGVPGRANVVRKERVMTYFLEGAGTDPD